MRPAFRCVPIVLLSAVCAFAQKTSSGTTTSGATSGTSSGGATGTTPSGGSGGATSTNTSRTPSVAPSAQTTPPPPRPVFISGQVVTDDGSALPGNISIQSLCGAQQQTVAHTSANGSFAFDWTANPAGMDIGDASQTSRAVNPGANLAPSAGQITVNARTADLLATCDLRASTAGYTSRRISLYEHSGLDSFDIGAITIHRVNGDEGRTVSALALKAPKDAKKSFEKGTEQMKAHKAVDAAVSFRKAVDIYPQYADSWYSLGKAELQTGAKDSAKADFQKAMDLDNKLVGPWQELGYMAASQSQWEDAARYLDQAVKLDPVDSPMAWYYSAVANYNLGHLDQAERSVRAEMRLEKNPQAQYVLAQVLIGRKDLKGGAEALRSYIALGPKPEFLEIAKKQLGSVESQIGQ